MIRLSLRMCQPGDHVVFDSGKTGTVVRQDGDDFDVWTVIKIHGLRKRSADDRHHYNFRNEVVAVQPPRRAHWIAWLPAKSEGVAEAQTRWDHRVRRGDLLSVEDVARVERLGGKVAF